LLDNTWRDTAKGIVNNWLGMVYEHTDFNARGRTSRSTGTNNPKEKA
jgi:homoserine O-succinyltransferase